MKRVLVTGANGHIGANTVRSLLKRGYSVAPLVRKGADTRGIEGLGLEYIYGDVMDYASLGAAVEGCDAIIHHAAVYKLWARDREEVVQPALVGVQNIFEAARGAGVRRLIYTSSTAAIGLSPNPEHKRSAEDWNEDPHSVYYYAKTESERLALRLSEQYEIPTIRLCPTQVAGPYDYRVTPTMKVILDFVNGAQTTYEGGLNYVHVYGVAEAHAAALELAVPGERYIVGGDNLHLKELADLIEKIAGVRPRHMGVTGPLAELTGALMGAASKLTGSAPPYDRALVQDVVGRYGYYDCSQTNEALGLAPLSAEQVVRDTIRWLLFIGEIKPAVAERISEALPPDEAW